MIFSSRESLSVNVQAHSDIIIVSNVSVIVLIVQSGVGDLITDWRVCVHWGGACTIMSQLIGS